MLTYFTLINDDVATVKIGDEPEKTSQCCQDAYLIGGIGWQPFEATLVETTGTARMMLSWQVDGQTVPVPEDVFVRPNGEQFLDYSVSEFDWASLYAPASAASTVFNALALAAVLLATAF